MTMKHLDLIGRYALVLTLLALVASLGCGASATRRYYTLDYPIDEGHITESRPALHNVRLKLQRFKVGIPYDRPQIVYRQSPFEFQYYTLRLWAAKPQKMIRAIVESHLKATRIVASVQRDYEEDRPNYELGAEIEAIEEYDSGSVWYAHLSMRFQLVRFADKVVVWEHSFDRKKQVAEKDTVYVIRALSEILRTEMFQIIPQIEGAIAKDRGLAPILSLPESDEKSGAEPVTKPDTPANDSDVIVPDPEAGQ